jgi:hypothetical protein
MNFIGSGLDKPEKARARLRMTRVLKKGETFNSTLDATLHRQGDVYEMRLDVHREAADSSAFLAVFRDGELIRAQWLAVEGESLSVDPKMPIGLGDMPIREVTSFYRLMTEDGLDPIGSDSTASSGQALVLEGQFVLPGDHLDARRQEGEHAIAEEADIRGATAMVWLNGQDFRIETVRVFNGRERLVRVYEDFRFGEKLRLERFSLNSIATESRTTFYIDDIERLTDK